MLRRGHANISLRLVQVYPHARKSMIILSFISENKSRFEPLADGVKQGPEGLCLSSRDCQQFDLLSLIPCLRALLAGIPSLSPISFRKGVP